MLLLVNCGCSSIVDSHSQKASFVSCYTAGDIAGAAALIDEKLSFSQNSGDELAYLFEACSVNFLLQDYSRAIAYGDRAEQVIREHDRRALVSVRDLSAESAAAVSNQNMLPFKGWCRDRIMLSFFKALNYVGAGNESAFRAQLKKLRFTQANIAEEYKDSAAREQQELNHAGHKLNRSCSTAEFASIRRGNAEFDDELLLSDKAAARGYGNFINPAALFLSGLGLIRDGNYENAAVEFRKIYAVLPNSRTAQKFLVTVLNKSGRKVPAPLSTVSPFDFSLRNDCIYVFFANGRGAALKQRAVYFPVMAAWPVGEYYEKYFDSLKIYSEDKTYTTELIADMDAVYAEELRKRLPGIVFRSLFSTLLKEAASAAAVVAVEDKPASVQLAVILGSLLYRSAFNTADTRCWELLPKELQLSALPLPRNRKLKIEFMAAGNRPLIRTLSLPRSCRSAIIYVSAVNELNVKINVLPFESH